jgi:serine/threonine protein kinase
MAIPEEHELPEPARAAEMLRAASEDVETLMPGSRVGAFRLESMIGRGAHGVVFRASQDRPWRRTVALKVLRHDAETARDQRRFELEQQTLASLSHPGIAAVLDAGRLPDGRPWFAMELVEGVPIDAMARGRQLALPQRLSLLAQLCEAVAYAHRKGVIHRDLKPSNVLVSDDGGSPRVRVLDFGVARAATGATDRGERLTMTGHLVGTIEFLSPEVAEHGAASADVRTDIYALGVLTCVVLTTRLPVELGDVRVTPLDERLRRIRMDAPRSLARLAAGADGAVPAESIRPDLQAVVERCLEKDPARRYPSAEALAEDLRRLADGESLDLIPLSRTQRARRFVTRHRLLAGVVATVATILVLSSAVSLAFARSASRAREAAEAALADALAAEQRTSRTVVGLWRAIVPVSNQLQFGSQRDLNVTMMRSMRDVLAEVFGPEHGRTNTAVREYARALNAAGRREEALEVYLTALPIWERQVGADSPALIPIRTEIAECLRRAGKPAKAVPIYEQVLAQSAAQGGSGESPVQAARRGLASALGDLGRFDEAERVAIEALTRLTLHPPPHPLDRAFMEGVLASILRQANRRQEAEEIYRALLASDRAASLASHPQSRLALGIWAGELASLLNDDGRESEVRPWLAYGLQMAHGEASPDNPTMRWMLEQAGCHALAPDGTAHTLAIPASE